jgi:hypothetical protein
MPPDFYPRNSCVRPAKVTRDGTARTSGGSAQYWAPTDINVSVAKFNKTSAAFNACIKTYADNARHDTQNILAVVNAAVADAQGTEAPAVPIAAGNMPAGFYPRSSCIKPDPAALGKSPSVSDRQAMIGYNLRVETFNRQALAFNACIKAYVDNGQRDIAAIQNLVQAAMADANAPLADPDPKGDFMTQRRR